MRRVAIATDRIRLELAPGAAADQYTLQEPFRIVFDVYRADAAAPRRRRGRPCSTRPRPRHPHRRHRPRPRRQGDRRDRALRRGREGAHAGDLAGARDAPRASRSRCASCSPAARTSTSALDDALRARQPEPGRSLRLDPPQLDRARRRARRRDLLPLAAGERRARGRRRRGRELRRRERRPSPAPTSSTSSCCSGTSPRASTSPPSQRLATLIQEELNRRSSSRTAASSRRRSGC